MENVIAICSYVPDQELQQMVKDFFPYHHIQYCNKIISSVLPKEAKIMPENSIKNCHCLLENGELIVSDYVCDKDLGIVYFENIINTFHHVVHWWQDDDPKHVYGALE